VRRHAAVTGATAGARRLNTSEANRIGQFLVENRGQGGYLVGTGGEVMTTTVNLAEAREQLPDLIRRMASGERVIIVEGGKQVAQLTPPPPPPPTAEEIAAAQARAEEGVRRMLALQENGIRLPDGVTIQDVLDEQRGLE
jgi:antitoxin (DNA-binding transcriptional repressor) of toxin-antitoxin stability system